MILASELKQWVNTLNDDDDVVGIDEGGLTLVTEGGAYLEVGGMSDEDKGE